MKKKVIYTDDARKFYTALMDLLEVKEEVKEDSVLKVSEKILKFFKQELYPYKQSSRWKAGR
mgnify:CR=1 FL=1